MIVKDLSKSFHPYPKSGAKIELKINKENLKTNSRITSNKKRK